jgi:hypothetical protein
VFRRYRQFEALAEREVNEAKRAEAEARRQAALERLEPLDLSRTTWPEYPPPAIVNAITFAARRGLHRYLDRHASELRAEIAALHGVAPERLVVGDGAAQLLPQPRRCSSSPATSSSRRGRAMGCIRSWPAVPADARSPCPASPRRLCCRP